MFCANCGKTLKPDSATCPHCGATVGENRFPGHTFTAAQPRIAPGEVEKIAEQFRPYTRITYSGMGEPEGDELDRTTYRPVLEENLAPEPAPEGEEAAPGDAPAEETADAHSSVETLFGEPSADAADGADAAPASAGDAAPAGDAPVDDALDIDPSTIHVEPVHVEEDPAISPESQRILSGEKPLPQKNERVKRSLLTDKLPFGRKETQRSLFDDAPAGESGEEASEKGDASVSGEAPLFGDGDEGSASSEAFDFADDGSARRRWNLDYGSIAKYAAIVIVIIAVFVGGYLWIDYVIDQKNASPIDGVSRSLYEGGIQYVDTLNDDSLRTEMIALYQNDPVAFLNRADGISAEINALAPESPQTNDALFVQAMQHIASNVANALTVDGMNTSKLANATAQQKAEINTVSSNNWTIVQNGIAALKAATSPAELSAIVNSQTVSTNTVVVEDIPVSPSPDASIYTNLAKGMSSDAVKAMQKRLIELGWLNDSADGAFGNKTEIAVKFFQQAAGFDVDGIASPEMQALLFSDNAPANPAAATPVPTAAPTPTPAA